MNRLQSLLLSPLYRCTKVQWDAVRITIVLGPLCIIGIIFFMVKFQLLNPDTFYPLYWIHDEIYLRVKGYFYYLLFPLSLILLCYLVLIAISLFPSYWSSWSLYRFIHQKVAQWAVNRLIQFNKRSNLNNINHSPIYRLLTYRVDNQKANESRLMMFNHFLQYQRKHRFNLLLAQPREQVDDRCCLELSFVAGLTLALQLGEDNSADRWLKSCYLWIKTFALIQTKLKHSKNKRNQERCLSHLGFGLQHLIEYQPQRLSSSALAADSDPDLWQRLFDDIQTLFVDYCQSITDGKDITRAKQAQMAWQQDQRLYGLEQIIVQSDQRFETFSTRQYDNSINGLADILPNLSFTEQSQYLHICAYYAIALDQYLGEHNYATRMQTAMESLHLLAHCQLLFADSDNINRYAQLLPTAALYQLAADLHAKSRQRHMTAWQAAEFTKVSVKPHHFAVDASETDSLVLAGLPKSESPPPPKQTKRKTK